MQGRPLGMAGSPGAAVNPWMEPMDGEVTVPGPVVSFTRTISLKSHKAL